MSLGVGNCQRGETAGEEKKKRRGGKKPIRLSLRGPGGRHTSQPDKNTKTSQAQSSKKKATVVNKNRVQKKGIQHGEDRGLITMNLERPKAALAAGS